MKKTTETSDIEKILGKDTFENIKKIANDNDLDISKYYTLAQEFKLASNICYVVANLLMSIKENS